MSRVSDHDDYMDVRAAWERYDRAYTSWGVANDGRVLNPKDDVKLWRFGSPATEPLRKAAATRMAKAAEELADAAKSVIDTLKRMGWKKPKSRKK